MNKKKIYFILITLIFIFSYFILDLKKRFGYFYLSNFTHDQIVIDSTDLLNAYDDNQQVLVKGIDSSSVLTTKKSDTTFVVGKSYYVNASEKMNVYFHKTPDIADVKASYFTSKELVEIKKIENGFAFIIFENDKKQRSQGWIKLSEMLLN